MSLWLSPSDCERNKIFTLPPFLFFPFAFHKKWLHLKIFRRIFTLHNFSTQLSLFRYNHKGCCVPCVNTACTELKTIALVWPCFGVTFILNFVKIGPRVCKVIGDTFTYTQFYDLVRLLFSHKNRKQKKNRVGEYSNNSEIHRAGCTSLGPQTAFPNVGLQCLLPSPKANAVYILILGDAHFLHVFSSHYSRIRP
jgi:hypothetical protein